MMVLPLLALAASVLPAQAPPPIVVLGAGPGRTLVTSTVGGVEMVPLAEVAMLAHVPIRDDPATRTVVAGARGRTAAFSYDQPLASVDGRLVSLSATARQSPQGWLVPLDAIPRALAPIADVKLDLRRSSRLLVVGNLRVPRVVARVEASGPHARLVIDLAPLVPRQVQYDGGRLIVRLEADHLDAELGPVPAGLSGLVNGLRLADRTTLVVDLGPRFQAYRAAETPVDGGMHVVIDVQASGTSTASGPTSTASTPPGRVPADSPVPAATVRTVVIDPGHGGDEPGVRGPRGTLEKDVVLAVARRVKAALETRLGARVVLTRDGDRTVGFDERAAGANHNKADLFISLHANGSRQPEVRGAEVYVLDPPDAAVTTPDARSVTLPVAGGGTRDVGLVDWERAQGRHQERSLALARELANGLHSIGEAGGVPVQPAPMRVLVGVNAPAAVVELGYLTSPRDEALLATPEYHGRLAQAVAGAVARVLTRPSPGFSPAGPPGGAR